MNKFYKYGNLEFTDGDILLLTYDNDEYESYKDLFTVWHVGVPRDFIDGFNYTSEGFIMEEGEGIPVGGDYEYPATVTKINSLDEVIKLSEILPKSLKDLQKDDTVVFKAEGHGIYFKFTFQHEPSLNEEYGLIECIDEDGDEVEFWMPVYGNELTERLAENNGFIQYLGVLPSSS